MRIDGRALNELRPCTIEPGFQRNALGSVLIATGRTRVLCSVGLEARPPAWLERGGWISGEYSMLPGSVSPRGRRDPGGRGKEIQRLIGRALRAAVDLERLIGEQGPLSLICDCDVIDADGGTRTAAVTGASVALSIAFARLRREGLLVADPLRAPVAAVSVGLVVPEGGSAPVPMLDLCYHEDSRAGVDLNVVELQGQGLVEVQGTAERGVFDRRALDAMLDLAGQGIAALHEVQRAAVEAAK